MTEEMDTLVDWLQSDEPRLGELSPPPPYAMTRFITPTFPPEPFMVTGPEDETGPYIASDWSEDADTGTMFCNPPDGSPQYLRVLSQDGNDIIAVDAVGDSHEWTFMPVPDNMLPAQDFDLPESQRQRASNMGIET